MQESRQTIYEYPGQLMGLLVFSEIFFGVILCCSLWVLFTEGWNPAIFICLLGFSGVMVFFGYALFLMSGRIVVDGESVIQERFNGRTQIFFKDILQVHHKILSRALVIRSGHEKIRIEKQLKDYPQFYEILSSQIPEHIFEYPITFPLEVRSRKVTLFIWCLLTSAIGVFLIWTGWTGVAQKTYLTTLMGTLFIGQAGFLWLKSPRKYYFVSDRIEIFYPYQKKIFPISDLKGFRLVRKYDSNQHQEFSMLQFVFKNKKFIIHEAGLSYPIELIYKTFKKYYPHHLRGHNDSIFYSRTDHYFRANPKFTWVLSMGVFVTFMADFLYFLAPAYLPLLINETTEAVYTGKLCTNGEKWGCEFCYEVNGKTFRKSLYMGNNAQKKPDAEQCFDQSQTVYFFPYKPEYCFIKGTVLYRQSVIASLFLILVVITTCYAVRKTYKRGPEFKEGDLSEVIGVWICLICVMGVFWYKFH